MANDARLKIIIDALNNASGELGGVARDITAAGNSATQASVAHDKLGLAQYNQQQAAMKLAEAQNALQAAAGAGAGVQDALQGEVLKAKVAFDQETDSVKRAQAEVESYDKANQKSTSGLANIGEALKTTEGIIAAVAASAAVLAGTWKVAMDLGKEGASINQLNASFAGLMGTEEAAIEMERRLSEAVHGTMTGEQLRGAMLKMLTGAEGEFAARVKESAPMLFEMAAASAKLNPVLGDTNSILMAMSQSLEMGTARGLKRQGIIVDQAKAEEIYAKSIGKTRNELDEEGRKVALLDAALEYHDTLLRQVGGTVESAVDPFKRLDVAVEESADKFKTALAPGLANAAEAVALLITWHDKLTAALSQHGKEVFKTTETYDAYIAEINRSRSAARESQVSTDGLAQTQKQSAAGVLDLSQAEGVLTKAQYESTKATEAATVAMQAGIALADKVYPKLTYGGATWAASLRDQKRSTEELKIAQDAINNSMALLSISMAGPVSKEIDSYNDKQAELVTKAKELKAELDKLQGSQGAVAKSDTKNAMSATDLALAQAKVTAATEALNNAHRGAKETEAEFAQRVAQLRSEIEGQTDKLGKANQSVTSYVDNSKKIGELKGQYDEVNLALSKNAQAHDDATKRIMFDLLSQRAAVGGLTTDEMKGLNDIALQWGLVDQKTHDAVVGIDSALAGLAANGNVGAFIGQINGIEAAAWNANAALQTMMAQQEASMHAGTGGAGALPTGPAGPGGAGMAPTGPPIHQAGGGDWMVNRPTLFMAGEAGPERATFTPVAQPSYASAQPSPAGPIPQASGGDWMVNRPTLFMAGEAGPERAMFTPTQDKEAPPPIPQAAGGDWVVNRPTLFVAGEAGPERATFTPMAQPSYASAQSSPAWPIPQAGGGDWMVNRPTLFMAGEAGPERATLAPQSNTHYQYNNTTNRAGDTFIIDDRHTGALLLEQQRRERQRAAASVMG